MPNNKERPTLQTLYPQPQDRHGMDARQPVKFTIPFFYLSLLLFLPIYMMIVLVSLYTYNSEASKAIVAVNSATVYIGILLAVVIGLTMLGYARRIIVRNCARPVIIEALYGLVLIPASLWQITATQDMFKGMNILQILGFEAIAMYVVVLLITLLAKIQIR